MRLVSVRESQSRITHFQVTGEADRVRVTWDAIPDASEYEVIFQRGDEEQRLLAIDTRFTFPSTVFLESPHRRLRIRPVFPSGGCGQWSDWLVIGSEGSWLISDAPATPAPLPQLRLANVQSYRAADELQSTIYRADFVTAEQWASSHVTPDERWEFVQSILFSGPFVMHGSAAPHPNTGAVAWLSAYTNPGRRWAIGPDAHLFASASVADLESYVTRWQGTIYDARPAA